VSRCDFCAGPDPVVVYAASRTSSGEDQQVWRWMACATCEGFIEVDNWDAVHARLLKAMMADPEMAKLSPVLLNQAGDMSLSEFHRYAVRRHIPKMEFTAQEIRDTYDELERNYPELWRICYPRIYSESPRCGNYYSPKEPARQFAAIALKVMQGTVGRSEQYEFLVASQLARYQMPMYWLGKDIAEAIRQTTPPGEIDWYAMPLPFEAAIFMLPKGSMRHPTEGNVEFIAYSRFRENERLISKLIPGRPYGSVNGALTMLALTEAGHLTHWNMPLDAFGERISLPDADKMVSRFSDDRHESGWFYQPAMTDDDNLMLVDLIHYIFGTLLLMTSRPDMVKLGTRLKHFPASEKKAAKEFWTPSIIGEDYRIRREASEYQGGHHASPRFHWVRGFYREQPFGERKLQQKKRIWIEPYTRGLGQ
jgi:hypothetical protein